MKAWFFEGLKPSREDRVKQEHWLRVMCLTGTGYFSSMGFQPGIAYLAAGLLSPVATVMLVALTLLGALPSYALVARESPQGEGSFGIFERLLSGWLGKSIVLVLLGFAATDFVFAITMCSADATVHIIENPWIPHFPHDQMIITVLLLASLGVVFLLGFQEAIRVSVWLVTLFLGVNLVAFLGIIGYLAGHQDLVAAWLSATAAQYPDAGAVLATSALALPQLALGLSGFETGVAVMPLIKTAEPLPGGADCVKKTRLLLITAAVIMSAFLLAGSVATTVLIPPDLFKEGGEANGRALAYLAHHYLGDDFGALYDLATVLILWFAGASAMAALLGFVPQYLPRYGMAPDWARAKRPLVVFFTLVCIAITWFFKADVDAQAAPFATGLLVLITSASVSVTLSLWRARPMLRAYFLVVSAAFLYASMSIMVRQPEGLQISLMFILAVLVSSFASRAWRSTELRIGTVLFDEKAREFIRQSCAEHWGEVRLLAHRPDDADYATKEQSARREHSIQSVEGNFIFLEVTPGDPSEFVDTTLEVTGHEYNGHRVLRCSSPGIPNAIAAILLHVRDSTGKIPHAYLGWTEGHPLAYMAKYILFGEGETAPLTREILRSAEPDPERRPRIHVA